MPFPLSRPSATPAPRLPKRLRGRSCASTPATTECETRTTAAPSPIADHAAEAVILAGLRKLTPGVVIIAEEENGCRPCADTRRRPALLAGRPARRHQGVHQEERRVHGEHRPRGERRPTLGIVLAPATGTLWRGAKGLGADKREGQAAFAPIRTRTPPSAGLTACASRSHGTFNDLDICSATTT